MQEPKYQKLKAIIKVYKDDVLIHRIEDGKVKNEEPLTKKSTRSLFKFITNEDIEAVYSFKGIIPSNVLWVDTEKGNIVWYTEPQKQHLFFSESMNIKDGIYPIPYLLWSRDRTGIKVYALDKKPDINSNIFTAPYPNISKGGAVCMGNAKIKGSHFLEDIIKETEIAFFTSIFTHTNQDEIIKGNYIDFMNRLKGQKEFPLDSLIRLEKKMKNVITK